MKAVYALSMIRRPGCAGGTRAPTQTSDLAYLPVSVDVHEDGDAFVISALMPGVKAEDLKIEVEGDTISLRGEIKTDKAEGEYLLRERYQSASWAAR